jgi:tetratricopeptide (TPR) repeat protein
MKRSSAILFAIILAAWQSGCTTVSDDPNTNNNLNSSTTIVVTNTDQINSNTETTAKKNEPVPVFTDANTALAEGNKYFDANETVKAIEAFKQAAKLNPDLAEAHFKLGVAHGLIEREKEAQVSADPTPTPTKTPKKGKEVAPKKDSEKAFEAAVKAYKKIIAQNPKDDVAHFNLGRSYNKLNDDKEAEKALRQAVKLKPDDSDYQTELAEILMKFAKYEEALGILKTALKLDPTNSQAQDLVEKAEAGKKRIEFGQPKDKPKDKPKGEPKKTSTNMNSSEDNVPTPSSRPTP